MNKNNHLLYVTCAEVTVKIAEGIWLSPMGWRAPLISLLIIKQIYQASLFLGDDQSQAPQPFLLYQAR